VHTEAGALEFAADQCVIRRLGEREITDWICS
jgi:hypothetical protein